MTVSISLEGKVALVTGASQGIGQGCALRLAQAGAAVAVTARNREGLAETVRLAEALGGRALALPADLTEPGAAGQVVAGALKALGRLDILVHVAGASRRAAPENLTEEDIDQALALKLKGAVALTRETVPRMGEGGSIVFIAGRSHREAPGLNVSGSFANASICTYAHALAGRLAPRGIRVNAVSPGDTYTPRMERMNAQQARLLGTTPEEVSRERLSRIPMGRFATPEDIGNAVLFLSSDLASFVAGVNLTVDGAGCRVVDF